MLPRPACLYALLLYNISLFFVQGIVQATVYCFKVLREQGKRLFSVVVKEVVRFLIVVSL